MGHPVVEQEHRAAGQVASQARQQQPVEEGAPYLLLHEEGGGGGGGEAGGGGQEEAPHLLPGPRHLVRCGRWAEGEAAPPGGEQVEGGLPRPQMVEGGHRQGGQEQEQEKLTMCFQAFQEEVEKIAPVQVRSQEEIMNECQVWWTLTGNFGNMMPIDWTKSYTRAKHLPTLNLCDPKPPDPQ